ncbi:MAG: CDP-alcohol phosphatidyltransferase family protein [Oscillospiraceae bacterium]|nr:CDP-alcohol phosphatidyltransferase family protein [Oscillospiraceae bacterium]
MKEFLKKNTNVPNVICILRIVLLIPFTLLYMEKHYMAALILLLISGISDKLDGVIARKYDMITEFGKLLDPIADKVTQIVLAVILLFHFTHTQLPLLREYSWVFAVFFGKEIFMLVGGAAMLILKMRPQASELFGKLATLVFYVVMCLILGFAPEIGAIALEYPQWTLPETVVIIAVALSAALSLAAFFSYVPGIIKEVKRGFAVRAEKAAVAVGKEN